MISLLKNLNREIALLKNELMKQRVSVGQLHAREIKNIPFASPLADSEFQVFSQFGDDGIIQYLVHHLDIQKKEFIEFGVEDYTESNTRFLLINNNWRGLVLDGNKKNIGAIKNNDVSWKYNLTAAHQFLTKENINEVIRQNNFEGEIGLLSIDVDGNDYWIWEAIDAVNPVIVIVEYNSVFGSEHLLTIPYEETFNRTVAHYSNLYWGASLPALCDLAEKKGYAFAGSNSAGNNSYFIKKEKTKGLKHLTAKEGYVESQYRESRDRQGNLTYVQGKERIREIGELNAWNVETKKLIKIKELF